LEIVTGCFKKSWNDRAENLNNRAIPDKFISVPPIINASDICDSLTLNWENLTKIFRTCMILKPRAGDSLVEYVFENEQVILNNQVYRSVYTSSLLKLAIFGHNYSKISSNFGIVLETKNQAIMHIVSQ